MRLCACARVGTWCATKCVVCGVRVRTYPCSRVDVVGVLACSCVCVRASASLHTHEVLLLMCVCLCVWKCALDGACRCACLRACVRACEPVRTGLCTPARSTQGYLPEDSENQQLIEYKNVFVAQTECLGERGWVVLS